MAKEFSHILIFFGKSVAESTGSAFHPETVPSVKIKFLNFPRLICFPLYNYF